LVTRIREAPGENGVSSRTCPDWPRLMELAPELQFKHYTLREAQLPADALVNVGDVGFDLSLITSPSPRDS
jgi:hypothetical protein